MAPWAVMLGRKCHEICRHDAPDASFRITNYLANFSAALWV